jgi:16S rRNA (uracil1498-N3)-methyltransferase
VGGVAAPLFLVDALPDGERVTLAGPPGDPAAVRQRVGEELLLGDGRGATATAVVTGVGRSTLELRVTGRRYDQPPAPRLVVVQAIAKSDRGELAVQALTEVGVDEVVPWPAARAAASWRGERGERAWARWVGTAREAARLARRSWLPAVAPATPTPAVATRLAAVAAGFVLHEQADNRLTAAPLPATGDIMLIIPPESGFAPAELATFEAAGAASVRLGPDSLRPATAAVAAISVLSARLQRW